MNTRFHSGTVIALGIAMMALLAGCGADEPVATNAATVDAGTATVPTFTEIQATLSLDDADATVVKGALADWSKAETGDQTQTRRGRAFRHEIIVPVV